MLEKIYYYAIIKRKFYLEGVCLGLEKIFKLKEHNTTVRREIVGGLTTFLSMAYILAVNPSILSASGMPTEAIFAATAISAAFATMIMAFFANYPVVLASGMGLNAYFAYSVVPLFLTLTIALLLLCFVLLRHFVKLISSVLTALRRC